MIRNPIFSILFICSFVYLSCASSDTLLNDIYISDVSVLLPNDPRVTYDLEAYNGCFQWSSTNPDVVDITTEDHECGRKIQVSAKKRILGPQQNERITTWVIAKDTVSHRTLKCEIILDRIDSIEIFTTTRNLSIDDTSPLKVQAFDKQRNIFTSLYGLAFDWKVTSTKGYGEVVKFVPHLDQFVDIPNIVLQMEDAGLRTASVLVKASVIGRSEVSAKFSDPLYQYVKEAKVSLAVRESLILVPDGTVYMAPHSSLMFSLQTFKDEKIRPVEHSYHAYQWTTENSTIARISKQSEVEFLTLGSTRLNVQSVSMEDNSVSCQIEVVHPTYVSIHIMDNEKDSSIITSKSTLVVGKSYTLKVDLYDRNRNKIYDTSNAEFEVKLDHEFFKVEKSTSNSDLLEIVPLKSGSVDVNVSLLSIGNKSLGTYKGIQKLFYKDTIKIVNPVSILQGKKIVLPYHPHHYLTLTPSGGSGIYQWYSTNPTVASINQYGQIAAKTKGTSIVKCTDRILSDNEETVEVIVADPNKLKFVSVSQDVEMGKETIVGVEVFDSELNRMHNCSSLPLDWKASTQIISLGDIVPCTEMMDKYSPCVCRRVTANREGQSQITVTYSGEKRLISDAATISTFKPFEISPPRLTLTYGSSVDLTISNGPQLWSYTKPSVPKIIATDDSQILIEDLNTGHHHAVWKFRVTCLKHGEQDLTVKIAISDSDPIATYSSHKIPFMCLKPHTAILVPKIDTLHSKKQSDVISSGRIPKFCSFFDIAESKEDINQEDLLSIPTQYKLRNNRILKGFVKVYDERGVNIETFNSLDIDVRSNKDKILYIADLDESKKTTTIKVSDNEDVAKVSVDIRGYDKNIIGPLVSKMENMVRNKQIDRSKLDTAKATPVLSRFSWNVDVVVAANLVMSPSRIVLYNHRSNRGVLKTVGGSGYHSVYVEDPSIAKVEFHAGKREIEITPLSSGLTKVMSNDICLGGSEIATTLLYISDVHAIKFKCKDMIKVGEQTTIFVELSDQHDNIFDSSQFKYMDFRINVDGSSAEITPQDNLSVVVSNTGSIKPTPRYVVVGKDVGVSSISLSVYNQMTGRTVTSSPLQIHVYNHLTILPKKLDLIPKASFQISAIGGPPFRSEIKYSTEEEDIIELKSDGLVVAKETLGKATVHATATIRGGQSKREERIYAGQDSIEVEVKELENIIIHSSSSRLIQGEEIVIRVMGSNMETPFAWGNVNVQFKWDVVNPEIVSLSSLYDDNTRNLDDDKRFSVVVRAVTPGKTRVNVIISAGPENMLMKTASVSFEVIPPLVFIHSGDSIKKSDIILSPGARYSVRSNLPSEYSLMEEDSKSVVVLDQKSKHVISKNVIGTSIVAIKERRDHQTSLVRVNVKPPHHIELRPRTLQIGEIPVGSTVDFDIILRDELGRKFDSYEGINFSTFLNRHEIINVQVLRSNDSDFRQIVRVKAIRPGQVTMMTKIVKPKQAGTLFTDPNHEDYQHIKITNAIFPINPTVHVGGSVHFQTTFNVPKDKYKRIWFTSDPSIATIDSETGIAVCHDQGSVTIYHESTVFTLTELVCSKVHHIEASECVKSSVYVNETVTEVPLCKMKLKFFAKNDMLIKESPHINQNIFGHCISKDPSLRARFMKDEQNQYICDITTDNKKYIDQDIYFQISNLDIDVADLQKSYILKRTVGIIVKEDFSIRGRKEVFLTPYRQTEVLEVRASVPLSIKIRDNDFISLYEISSDPETEITRYEIKAKVVHHPFTTILTFESIKSKRTEEVLVIFRETGDDITMPNMDDIQGYQVLWITLVVALASIVATYIYTLMSNKKIRK